MTTETTTYKCPARKCGKPAERVGDQIVCKALHLWRLTEVELVCPRCTLRTHHIQVKTGLVACVACSKAWRPDRVKAVKAVDKVKTVDDIQAGLVDGGPACARIMRAVDEAAGHLLGREPGRLPGQFPPDWLAEAVFHGETSLDEIVGRFRRNLVAGGVQKE
ncbi:hypothetical protein LCGC14_0724290 [marine sediment metagenome]|uniref:Uncharacterized protein n=1 Tax=marine sediment metagenome TaxID=412755 RepID=A0A0F9QWG9_9ZZZZ